VGVVPRRYPLKDKDGNYIDYSKLLREHLARRFKGSASSVLGLVIAGGVITIGAIILCSI